MKYISDYKYLQVAKIIWTKLVSKNPEFWLFKHEFKKYSHTSKDYE